MVKHYIIDDIGPSKPISPEDLTAWMRKFEEREDVTFRVIPLPQSHPYTASFYFTYLCGKSTEANAAEEQIYHMKFLPEEFEE